MIRIASAGVALLCLAACTGTTGGPLFRGDDLGVVRDPALKDLLRDCELVSVAGCTLRPRPGAPPLPMRCRVFRGPGGEELWAAYDVIADVARVVFLVYRDESGELVRQEIFWLPAQRERADEPRAVI